PHAPASLPPRAQPPPSFAPRNHDHEPNDSVTECRALRASRGSPDVASERHVRDAYVIANRTPGIDLSPTGASGLAGLHAARDRVADDERVAIVFSGIRRETPKPA
ncbi:MAG: hypothetical protein ACKOJG_04650, partial [Actinomycetota bacterium]